MLFSSRFLIIQVFFTLILGLFLVCFKVYSSKSTLPLLYPVNKFSLLSQDNQIISLNDLKGSVWVADFVFTTCSGICPMMTKNMSALAKASANRNDIKMVSISVNPENDTPDVLKKYANKFKANQQWLFLTGKREDIQDLAVNSFKIGDMKEIVFHSSMFVLVDRNGWIRGYYDSGEDGRLKDLYKDLEALYREINLPLLPSINATLNCLSGILLFLGYMAIRNHNKILHRNLMLGAIFSSGLFLTTYLYYHATTHILTRYQGMGFWRGFYFFILGTHTPLAIIILPFIFLAVKYAINGDFSKHTKITRWLYPTWAYVSVTGVIVYLMLYVFKSA